MNAQTVGWLVFLAVTKNFSCGHQVPFELEGNHLTAKEGSCIEIKCTVTKSVDDVNAHWFWMKNAIWTQNKNYFATIIYSTNNSICPVSPDFADRVKYIGSPSSSWKNNYASPKPKCSILICNLNKTDSGNYSFRYLGKLKWITKPAVILTVTENPCLITFEKPPVVKELNTITLTCSTLSSCPSNPHMTQLPSTQLQQRAEKQKSTTASFTVNWQDDGKEFSCQTQDNKDTYLIRNISLTVEYAPKEILTEINATDVKEGQSVTLTCSAKGRPDPTFTWFKNDQTHSGKEWAFTSIKDSQSGEYHCKAKNKHGTIKSNPVIINVTYVPQVEMTSSASVVKQGDKITLTCNVKRSNPQPHTYVWLKDRKVIGGEQTYQYVVESIEPEDSGFYTCTATNTVGTGRSDQREITVEYSPRKTSISISEHQVKVGHSLTFTCNTDANPPPTRYSWYRYNNKKQIDSSQWKSWSTNENSLSLTRVQRADEACYMCNATNIINTGENSEPKCIQVLYPPTNVTLSMDSDVREGQLITINCTVESFPPSEFTLTRTSTSNPQSSEWHQPINDWRPNTLQHTFNVTSTHTGFYTCNAKNSEGSNKSTRRKLVVKYRPNSVTVQAQPGLVVNENMLLTLRCSAQSHPPVTSVTWMKMTDGKSEIIRKTWTFTVKSVSPSDSGLYSCAASNEIGSQKSQQAEVKVKYAPKHTKITRAAEQQLSDGMSSVMLSCSSHSYPPVIQYSWYKKIKAEKSDVKVSDRQNYTVSSDQPGVYYCIAKNEINQRASDPIQLFDRSIMTALKFFFLSLTILLVICLIFFVCRHKRNKSIQQGTTNTLPCFGFLGGWNGARRRNLINEPVMAEPFRSRDDLLPDQPCHPKAQRRQPRPDSTPASNINSVYCTVNLPAGKKDPSAQKPIRQQGGHTVDDSLNYTSLHFGNKQKNKEAKAEADVVYAVVLKQKPPKKNEQERLEDYENVSTAQAAKSPNPLNYDTDTSEDEVEVNYSQVSFKIKPGHQRAGRDSSSDSSTSDEEETQYSDVKF